MVCAVCNKPSKAIHIYGYYQLEGKPRDKPMNELELCDDHGHELWEGIKSSVQAGYTHYEIHGNTSCN